MNTEAINILVSKWSEPNGIPFKGSLISADGCMCAQGQALHYVGGWDADRLRDANQGDADRETAQLLGISVGHAILLRRINDGQPGAPSIVLTNPEKVLGDQAHIVLAFWRHLDRMTFEQWAVARDVARDVAWDVARDVARDVAWDAARAVAWEAARAVAWDAAGDVAWDAARDAARDAAGDAAWDAAGATNEIQGAGRMRAKGQAFYFLPMFGFADPEAVLAADKEFEEQCR